MRFEIIQQADGDTVYAPDAFASSIGKTSTLKVEGRGVGQTKLIAAEVSEDGKTVRLTFETDDAGDLLNLPPR